MQAHPRHYVKKIQKCFNKMEDRSTYYQALAACEVLVGMASSTQTKKMLREFINDLVDREANQVLLRAQTDLQAIVRKKIGFIPGFDMRVKKFQETLQDKAPLLLHASTTSKDRKTTKELRYLVGDANQVLKLYPKVRHLVGREFNKDIQFNEAGDGRMMRVYSTGGATREFRGRASIELVEKYLRKALRVDKKLKAKHAITKQKA